MLDAWGAPVAASKPETVDAWNDAWGQALHFVGDPFATLSQAIGSDEAFALGSIFCCTYRLLGGAPPDAAEVRADLATAEERAHQPRELGHLEALRAMVAGDFTIAARRWDRVNREHRDFAAVRFAHDVYLHVGNSGGRLKSAAFAIGMFDHDPGWNFVASQYAFALEEAGYFDEAERVAFEALEADPMDLWATHALAHVYESVDDQAGALDLLRSREHVWAEQDGLSVHIWWHLALRLIAGGSHDEVLDIHDRLVGVATTPFRLCDLASMLWRLELAGIGVGDRWSHLADAFALRPERHTSGFLDLHAALVYTRQPDHPEAPRFFEGLAAAHAASTQGGQESENARTFRTVVRPLVQAISSGEADPVSAAALLDSLEPTLHQIGGSNAQRDLVTLTQSKYHSQLTASEAT